MPLRKKDLVQLAELAVASVLHSGLQVAQSTARLSLPTHVYDATVQGAAADPIAVSFDLRKTMWNVLA